MQWIQHHWPLLLPLVLGACGVWLLMPGKRAIRPLGGLAALGALALGFQLVAGDKDISGAMYVVISTFCLISAVLMITSKNPVYGALWFALVTLCVCGLFLLQSAPFLAAASIIVYAGAIGWVIPKLEAEKVVPDVARWVAAHAAPQDRVATFRLNRWNTAYRFYVNRQVTAIESDESAQQFFSDPTPFYCVMTGALYDALKTAGVPMRVAYEREGRWVTSGRALWRQGGDRTRFVVAVPDQAPAIR